VGGNDPSRGPSLAVDNTREEEDDYDVAKLRRQYQDFQGAKREELKEQRIARHYYAGDQWSSDELKILKARRQPAITRNRIARKIDAVVGLVERLRQDPKAYPRSPPPALPQGIAAVMGDVGIPPHPGDPASMPLPQAGDEGMGVPPTGLAAGLGLAGPPPPNPASPPGIGTPMPEGGSGGPPLPAQPPGALPPSPGGQPGGPPPPPQQDEDDEPGDLQEEGADVATAAIRYVLDNCEWQTHSTNAAREGAINGVGGIELALEEGDHSKRQPQADMSWDMIGALEGEQRDQVDPDVTMADIDPDTVFYDPRSMRLDFSDARYMGVAKWLDLDLAREMFPDQEEQLNGLVSVGTEIETWQQRDRERRWIDVNDKRLFVVEHWYKRRGDWWWCFYTGNTILMRGKSPFINEKNKTFCRFILYSVNSDHDGDRYGFVRNLKPLQDEINARASKALHLINVRRIIMEEGAAPDIEVVRQEAVRPDGVMVVSPGKRFELDDQAQLSMIQGQLEFLQQAITEVENFGPNPAVIGQGIENKSGRAIALLQQAGIAELGPYILSYRGWKIRVYRAIWNIIQHNWSAERWIRVTDNEGLAKFLLLNGERYNEYGQPSIVNAVGDLDVDIVLDEGPDSISLMMDTYDALQALAQQGTAVPPEVLIELSPIPAATKRKLLKIVKDAQKPDPEVEQVNRAGALANIDKTASETAKNQASAQKMLAEIPGTQASAGRDKAAAFRDITDAVLAQHREQHPSPFDVPGAMPAGPDDGGIGGAGQNFPVGQ
jgi:hypothetical protein